MQTSPTIENIAPAFCNFMGAVKNPATTANNPFYKSKYAPLPDILNLVRPLLFEHGLFVFQDVSAEGVTTMLIHKSGEWMLSGPLPLMLYPTTKVNKETGEVDTIQPTPQAQGSAVTYARRYALCALLNITGEEDDDANTAEPPKPEPVHQKAEGPRTEGGATVKQVNFCKKLFVDRGIARKGAKDEDPEARQARRDDNMIAVYEWLQEHKLNAPEGTDPLSMMEPRDISQIIDTLKAEIAEVVE